MNIRFRTLILASVALALVAMSGCAGMPQRQDAQNPKTPGQEVIQGMTQLDKDNMNVILATTPAGSSKMYYNQETDRSYLVMPQNYYTFAGSQCRNVGFLTKTLRGDYVLISARASLNPFTQRWSLSRLSLKTLNPGSIDLKAAYELLYAKTNPAKLQEQAVAKKTQTEAEMQEGIKQPSTKQAPKPKKVPQVALSKQQPSDKPASVAEHKEAQPARSNTTILPADDFGFIDGKTNTAIQGQQSLKNNQDTLNGASAPKSSATGSKVEIKSTDDFNF